MKNLSSISFAIMSIGCLALFSCTPNPKEKYLDKEQVGMFGEDQGMTTFEGQLYADSTFYIPGGFTDWAEGTYSISKDQIHFTITAGHQGYFDPISLALDSNRSSLTETNLERQVTYVYFED